MWEQVKSTKLLAYADDKDMVGRSQSAVRDAYLALEREAAKGRFVTWAKVWQHFEVVKEFVYLGSLITPTHDVSREIQQRI
jgi:hypothetical protein